MALQVAGSFSGTGVRQALGTSDSLYVGSAVVAESTDAIAVTGIGRLHKISIFGSVFGVLGGVNIDQNGSTAGNNAVMIGRNGQLVSDQTAIRMVGPANSVLNYGEVSSLSGSAVIFAFGGDGSGNSKLINYGSISAGDVAISASGYALFVRNYGDITSLQGTAIASSNADDVVQNFGQIDGDLDLLSGANRVINRGTISGDIDTGVGSDFIDNRGGTITGAVRMGDGLDTFRPGVSDETVDGGLGSDLLDFSRSSGVQFALDGSIAATGWAFGDSFTGFEDLQGSLSGADVLTGDGNANSIFGGGGNDTLSGMAGIDTLFGDLGNDRLDGGTGNDFLYGGAGQDVLIGGDGDDDFRGQDGNDTIIGGAGRDGMGGNFGTDTFAFAKGDFGGATALTADVIFDFTQSEKDKIDLSAVDASSRVAGDQAFAFIGTAAFSNVAGQLRFTQISGSTYVQGDTNGDGVADFWIGLSGLITLKAADFVL